LLAAGSGLRSAISELRAAASGLRSAVVVLALLAAACGDSPTSPGKVKPPPPPPPPPPVNAAPSITAVAVQGIRRNEPPNFADLSESVAVSATVTDQETAVDQLQYNWTATLGSFTGTGPRVTWQAPAAAATPATVTLTLEVIEKYGTGLEHRVTATAEVALHNSAKEVGDMARQFLLDFSDSDLRDVGYIMRNFEPGCYGTSSETEDVVNNRASFRIVSYSVGSPSVTVNFGGTCPFRARAGDACAQVPVFWASVNASSGVRQPDSRGTDQVAAMYYRAQRRWRLCDSQFNAENGIVPYGFIR
jgi:hypothetical protein